MSKFLGVLLFLLSTLAIQVHAQETMTPDRKDQVKKLLDVTGALNMARSMSAAAVKQLANRIKKARPNIPADTVDEIASEVNRTFSEVLAAEGGLVDALSALYAKYYSEEEINALITFYETPLGKKMATVAPRFYQEASVIGQRFTRGLTPLLAERIKAILKQKGFEA